MVAVLKMKYDSNGTFQFISANTIRKIIYIFYHVHLSEDEVKVEVSPDLTTNTPEKLKSSGGPITQDNTGVEYYCTIFAANESPIKEGLIWVGSDDGLLHLTRNGGENWENVTPKDLPEWLMVNSIEPSAFDPAVCYVAGTLYKTGNFKPYLYKTVDYGKNWSLITNGIDAEHFTRVLRADPQKKGLLFAGTETGMYISHDDGISWNPFQLNLPIVPITDLTIKNGSLIVSTQGRGIWILDDLTVIHQINPNTINQEIKLFKPKKSYRILDSGGLEEVLGKSDNLFLTQGTNLANGVIIHFNIKRYDSVMDKVAISIKEKDGTLIKKFSNRDKNNKLKVKKGGNTFVWNTLYNGPETPKDMIFWSASFDGAKAVPGEYKVVLEKNQLSEEQDFTILPDPRSEVSISQMKKQFDFINNINKTVDRAHRAIKNIRIICKKLKDFVDNYSDVQKYSDLMNKAKSLSKSLNDVEKTLYQTQNKSAQDPLNFPIRLTNKLGYLNSLVANSDFPPTNQDELVRIELTNKVNFCLSTYDKLISEDLENFNKAFAELNLDYLTIK